MLEKIHGIASGSDKLYYSANNGENVKVTPSQGNHQLLAQMAWAAYVYSTILTQYTVGRAKHRRQNLTFWLFCCSSQSHMVYVRGSWVLLLSFSPHYTAASQTNSSPLSWHSATNLALGNTEPVGIRWLKLFRQYSLCTRLSLQTVNTNQLSPKCDTDSLTDLTIGQLRGWTRRGKQDEEQEARHGLHTPSQAIGNNYFYWFTALWLSMKSIYDVSVTVCQTIFTCLYGEKMTTSRIRLCGHLGCFNVFILSDCRQEVVSNSDIHFKQRAIM